MKKVSERLILLTGATGQQGHAVLRHLLTKGFPVRASTRDPDQKSARALDRPHTEVVRGDMNNLTSLRNAASGAFGVFSMQPISDPETEVQQGINVAEAARLEVANHLVYSSMLGADLNSGVMPFKVKGRIEEHIRLTGLSYTILRPVFFMENWFGQKDSIDTGTLRFPFQPDTRLQMIAVDDIGALVALAFEHRGHWLDKTMDIAGDELAMFEIVEAFSRAGTSKVKYQQIGWDEYEQQVGPDLTLLLKWLENSGHRADIEQVRADHRNLSNFERWLNTQWQPAHVPLEMEA
jgi:uncharacterized protein YbjT (DUF2867 family)